MKSLGLSTPSVVQNWKTYSNARAKASKWSCSCSNNQIKSGRRIVISTTLATSTALFSINSPALAENWGVRSFIWEKFFEPDLSPEDSVARITQTAQGLHALRHMVDTMAWRYVIFYIRVKQSYLSKDLNIAMSTLPKSRLKDYVDLANDLVHNLSKMDEFIRTPKVYESYLYYEKTLKSIDDIVAYLA
ncbi:PsbQ-like 2 [Euphorbia peplus]|nr:PsbQ-like 2 [Euphorbia peplus]